MPSAAAWYGYTWLLGCTTTVVVLCRQLAASSFIILHLCIKSAYERWWYNVMVTLAHTCCSWRLTWGWEHIWGWHWTWLCPMWNHPGKYPEQISGDAAITTGTRFKELSPLCETNDFNLNISIIACWLGSYHILLSPNLDHVGRICPYSNAPKLLNGNTLIMLYFVLVKYNTKYTYTIYQN